MICYHHEHSHGHDHDHHHHDHDHPHCHENGCGSCTACDPMQEALALMDYMVKHNTAHANELAQLAKRLEELGNGVAAQQVMAAVSEFEKGNLRLSAVLASLK
ncbi:MAG: cobalt transporter [Oscillospiraceae bacterium]|nr:cobalt transporter [Oscillospiraceae bacterium]